MSRDRAILFYPLVLATVPVVFFYAENTREAITLAEFSVTLAAVIAATVIFILLLKLFIRDSAKVGVIVSLFLAIFFAYGFIHDILIS